VILYLFIRFSRTLSEIPWDSMVGHPAQAGESIAEVSVWIDHE
jgi:hypothetical protein